MKELFKEVVRINSMEDARKKEECAKKMFAGLNTMELPEYFNWAEEIFEDFYVRQHPDKTCLIWTDIDKQETRSLSYGSLAGKANQLLNYFLKSGVEKGDNLYTMSPVLSENWVTALACIKAGIVSVPTATTMTVRELGYRFETFPPEVVIADEASAHIIDEALYTTRIEPKLKLVVGQKEGWVSFDMIDNESIEAAAVKTRSDDTLFCFFTSGTTGLPKRVAHTALSYPVGHLATTVMIGIKPSDIHHNMSTPGWAKWTWSGFFAPLSVGAATTGFNIAIPDTEQYLDAISSHGVTSLCAPPNAWKTFANMNLDSFNLGSIQRCVSAGEPLNPDVMEKWKQHTGMEIRDFYGQTESTAMIGNPPWMKGKIRPGSFGHPFFMYDMALVDNEGNEITRSDQVGHIVVRLDRWRAVGLFSEYIGNPATLNSVFVDQYYYTGDRGLFDKDGYWWFVSRADDVIKSSDYRIGPFEVESALTEHPAVREVAVVGTPDPNRHQLVKAYVILNPDYQASRNLALELFRHSITILPKFKIPRMIEFVPDVPKTVSGKIRRVELRQMEDIRQGNQVDDGNAEYVYWDFPELSAKKRL